MRMIVKKDVDLKTQILMEVSYARGYLCNMDESSCEQEYLNLGDMLADIESSIQKYLISDPEVKMSDHKFKVLYEGLSEYQMGLIEQMKYHASRIGEVLEELNKSREVALAYTNLEQGMMWAIKAVCMEGEAK